MKEPLAQARGIPQADACPIEDHDAESTNRAGSSPAVASIGLALAGLTFAASADAPTPVGGSDYLSEQPAAGYFPLVSVQAVARSGVVGDDWKVDPGAIIDKIVIHTGGPKGSCLGPPESNWHSTSPPDP